MASTDGSKAKKPKKVLAISTASNSLKKKKLQATYKKTFTKKQLLTADTRKIPRHILDDTLKLAKSNKICEDNNKSCSPAIHIREFPNLANTCTQSVHILKHARLCLLRRDWSNLAKLLALCYNSDLRWNCFVKYAAICLSHTDKNLFHTYLQTIHNFDDGPEKALEHLTKLPTTL